MSVRGTPACIMSVSCRVLDESDMQETRFRVRGADARRRRSSRSRSRRFYLHTSLRVQVTLEADEDLPNPCSIVPKGGQGVVH
jgi:hypothetical protein